MAEHWLAYPTVWPAPIPFLARLAPETGEMRIKTSVLLLPLLNPVEVAENVATLDHLTHGRLTLGVSIGYRETELAAAGVTRRDRVPRLEEPLELMKRLWAGAGAHGGRKGFTPCPAPDPPHHIAGPRLGATPPPPRLGPGVLLRPHVPL